MTDLSRLQKAIVEEHLDGWLFFHFRGRDSVTAKILKLSSTAINTRPAYFFVPAHGAPTKIVHTIEKGIFDSLPGEVTVYATRGELLDALRRLPKGKIAAQFSEELPVISFLDHGTARTLEALGIRLVGSGSLIQRTVGVLDPAGIASHERSASHLYEIVDVVWRRIARAFGNGDAPNEGLVQQWIMEEFAARGLMTDHPPIVACGLHSSNPHYEPPPEGGAGLAEGQVLQLDLWAKEGTPGSIYADISWVGVLAERPNREIEATFKTLCMARDRGVEVVSRGIESSTPVTGYEVDEEVRKVLIDAGFEGAIRHRTGHGIDTEDHGSGVNLDSIEFPDRRRILEGSCFSIEPGIYLGDWGLRTEINLYIHDRRTIISGGSRQNRLLDFS